MAKTKKEHTMLMLKEYAKRWSTQNTLSLAAALVATAGIVGVVGGLIFINATWSVLEAYFEGGMSPLEFIIRAALLAWDSNVHVWFMAAYGTLMAGVSFVMMTDGKKVLGPTKELTKKFQLPAPWRNIGHAICVTGGVAFVVGRLVGIWWYEIGLGILLWGFFQAFVGIAIISLTPDSAFEEETM